MIRHILSWYLTIVVGLTHVGIPVFAHICHSQGKMWFSMVLPSKSSCGEDDVKSSCIKDDVKSLPGGSCHSQVKPATTINAKPCCENKTGLLKIESSYCSSLPGFESKISQTDLYVSNFVLMAFNTVPGFSQTQVPGDHAPPDPIHGRELCIRLQNFRC